MLKIRVEDRWGGEVALWTRESRVLLVEGPDQLEAVRRLEARWDAAAFAALEPVVFQQGPFLATGAAAPFVIQAEPVDVPRLALIADPESGLAGLLELEPGAAGERALVMDRLAILAVRFVDTDGQVVEQFGANLRLGTSSASMNASGGGLVAHTLTAERYLDLAPGACGFLTIGRGHFGIEELEVPFDAWTPPGEPLREPFEVVVPDFGSARLVVTYSNGQEPTVSTRPVLAPEGFLAEWEKLGRGDQWLAGFRLPTASGRGSTWTFDQVPCGRVFELWVGAKRGTAELPEHGPFRVLGPEALGGAADWAIEIPTPGYILDATLQTTDGELEETNTGAMSGLHVIATSTGGQQLRLVGDNGFQGPQPDAEGRVRLELDAGRGVVGGLVMLELLRFDSSTLTTRIWRREFTPPLAPGEHGLGALLAEPQVRALSGQVVDEEGVGVERAMVAVYEFSSDLNSVGHLPMKWFAQPSAIGAADGSFEVLGPLTPNQFVVRAQHGLRISALQTVRAGAEGVVFVVKESGTLAFETSDKTLPRSLAIVPAGGGWPDRSLSRFHYWSPDSSWDDEETSWEEQDEVERKQRERLEARVPHGAYDLWWIDPEAGQPRAVVRGIVVPAGGVSDDERLVPLRFDE